MLQTDPLSFLDEEPEINEPIGRPANRRLNAPTASDPLSFLDELSEPKQSLAEVLDPLSFLEESEEAQGHWYDKLAPKSFKKDQKLFDIYRPEEKTPQELKNMSLEERREYAEDLNRFREVQQSRGFTKGALSGLTFGASEHIPGLKPDEEDLLVGLGDVVGSYLPIAGLYKFLGAPLVHFASKSPVARGGLEALARMTGFGLTGVAHKQVKGVVKGEMPTVEELAKEGATWAAIDAALQTAGLGIAFTQSVNRIAKAEGITAREVLGKLWESTKNFAKSKFGRPIKGEVLPEDAEVLLEQAKKAEAEITPKETDIEVRPVEEKAAQPKEQPLVNLNEKLESELTEAKTELNELEKSQGKGATQERSALIQKINELELEKHNRAKGTSKAPVEKELSIPENAVLTKPEHISIGIHGGKGTATVPVAKIGEEGKEYYTHEVIPVTKEEQQLIDGSNAWDRAGDQKESSELANQARKMIFDRVKGQEKPETEELFHGSPTPINLRDVTTTQRNKYGSGFYATGSEEMAEKYSRKFEGVKGHENYQELAEKYNIPEKTVPTVYNVKAKNKPNLLNIEEAIPNEIRDYLDNLSPESLEKMAFDQKHPSTIKGLYDDIHRIGADENIPHDKRVAAIDRINRQIKDKGFNGITYKENGIKEAVFFEPKRDLEIKVSKAEHAFETELLKKPTQVPPRRTRPLQPVVGKKQAVARSKIIDLFRTAFTDPIRLGKIAQKNAAGIHKLWPKVTRLLKDNDIETVAHEIGHNLHTTLYGGNAKTSQSKNIEAALRPYLGELKPLAHYEPWGMEGFAEFTRLYVTNPDVALELAPKFYAKFEVDLEAQYPEMKNALLQAREYYDAYLQGTPQSRIRAQTSYGSDKGKHANIVDSVKKYLNPDFLKTQFLDDVFPSKRLVAEAFGIPISEVENLKDERNLYRSLRVLKGAVGKGDVFVLHETFNPNTLKKTGGSLRDILKQLPDEESYRGFNDYLIARRSIEKTSQDIVTGIHAGDAITVEADLRPKYGKLAEELDKYNDSLLNYAKDSGLLSNEQYKMIKDNNVLYTPFQRVMEPEKGGVASGGGRLQAGKPIKRMKGSTRNIIAPIESIIKNTYAIILNSEKNLAGQVLAKIAKMKNVGGYVEKVPTPIKLKGKIEGGQVSRELAKRFEQEGLSDLIEYDSKGKPVLREDIADAIPEVFLRFGAGQYPAGENIITVYNKGKPEYYEVSKDSGLFEMWNKGIAPYEAGLITKILRMPARTLRAGAILNPRFIQKNIIRDTWGSWLFTKYGKSIKDPVGLLIDTLYNPLEMVAASAMKRTLYIEWLKSGGGMSTMQSLDRNSIVKKLEEIRSGTKSHQVIKWLRKVAEISEEANRLSEFGKALAVEQKSRLGAEIAAFAARDLSVDFAKMGLQTKALNQIIPFWNATVQGGDKLLRTMVNPEDRNNFLPRVIGFLVLPSLMLAWLNKDDERVKEFHEEEKDFNFITFVGDTALKIPVPFETGVLSHGLTQRMFNYFMKEDPEAFEGFMGSAASAMIPNVIPTIANPFIEAWSNKNFFTGGRIIPRNQEELISRYQYKRGTTMTARLLGRAMTYMLGQETRSKAASPEIIDHFINSWTGGLGRLAISISDASLEAAGLGDKVPGPQQTITEQFGFDAFVARYPRASSRSIEKFYDNYADATSRLKSLKYAEKMVLETPESQQAAYNRFDKIYDYNSLQHSYKAIQASQKAINNIWNDPSIEQDLKEKMIDDLYLQQIEFAKVANEDIRKHRITQKD